MMRLAVVAVTVLPASLGGAFLAIGWAPAGVLGIVVSVALVAQILRKDGPGE
ncbi:hypothetical protein [Cellulosimicrobium arenosum]|uniref:Uncharacterized protein n=1 Tax=Cellulosimicrobium arenosum TaxID=2708133 RepID=A0A927G6Y2_9MICO|nr:hypothetical protein [Cellulosimicrobium arenosum]MBD8077685.1 hypothetical protein [Cellulosimicrobium arenosum]